MRTAARYAWGIGLADAKATDRALALARRLDVAATVYTVNDERRMRELVDASVGAIFTDRPDLLRRVLSQA
jgi:glycerophosphoryl diester phosphodiesterase